MQLEDSKEIHIESGGEIQLEDDREIQLEDDREIQIDVEEKSASRHSGNCRRGLSATRDSLYTSHISL